MDRRQFIKNSSAGALFYLFSQSTLLQAKKQKRPNVLFIAVDDLRPQLGCYGFDEIHSPTIDQLAAEGLLFERAYCQQAICAPSRISLLSGLRCETTQIYGLETRLQDKWPEVISLPKHFKNHGYATVSIGKIYHHKNDDLQAWTSPPFRAMKGSGYVTDEAKLLVAKNRKYNPNSGSKGPATEMADVEDNLYSDGQLAEKAMAELNRFKDKPFFLALGFRKPHLPFTAPKKYWDIYNPAKLKLAKNPYPPDGVTRFSLSNFGELRNYYGMPKGKEAVSDEDARHLIHGYYACVSFIDAQIGKVVKELERLGLRDNTIIVLWGDHGWKLGEHGSWCKHTNFEIDVNAPLILSVPGIKQGIRTRALTEFVDIYPTLCDLCNLPKPKHLEGVSFVPLLNNPEQSWKKAAFSLWVAKKYRYDKNTQIIGYAMKTDRYRYIEWRHTKSGKIRARELYDHSVDPQENVNVIDQADYKNVALQLKSMMEKGWKGALPTSNFK